MKPLTSWMKFVLRFVAVYNILAGLHMVLMYHETYKMIGMDKPENGMHFPIQLVGILVGQYWSDSMGSTAELLGAVVLGAYGLFLIVRAWLTPEPEGLDGPWAVCGLLVPLSMDNVAAGTS